MPKYVVIRNTQKIENAQEIIADNPFDAAIKAGYSEDKLRPWDLRTIRHDWGSVEAKMRAENAPICVVEYECEHDKLSGNYFEILNNINYGVNTFLIVQ